MARDREDREDRREDRRSTSASPTPEEEARARREEQRQRERDRKQLQRGRKRDNQRGLPDRFTKRRERLATIDDPKKRKEARRSLREDRRAWQQKQNQPPTKPLTGPMTNESLEQQNYFQQNPETVYWGLLEEAGAPITAETPFAAFLRDQYANDHQEYQTQLPMNQQWTSIQDYYEQEFGPNRYTYGAPSPTPGTPMGTGIPAGTGPVAPATPGTNPYTGQPTGTTNPNTGTSTGGGNKNRGNLPSGFERRRDRLQNLQPDKRKAARRDLQADIKRFRKQQNQPATTPSPGPFDGGRNLYDHRVRNFLAQTAAQRGEDAQAFGGGPVRWSVF